MSFLNRIRHLSTAQCTEGAARSVQRYKRHSIAQRDSWMSDQPFADVGISVGRCYGFGKWWEARRVASSHKHLSFIVFSQTSVNLLMNEEEWKRCNVT
jgi:hypothetical protein